MKQYIHRYRVRGAGAFPLDMLRYDRSSPDTSEDVARMDERDERSIRLVSYVGPPEVARWASFGWRVADTSKETRR